MHDSRESSSTVVTLLTTVVIVAVTVSAIWAYFWHQQQLQHHDQLTSLETSLTAEREKREALLTRIGSSEQSRSNIEQQLNNTRNALEETQAALAAIEAEHWPTRYQALSDENAALEKKLERLQLEHNMAQDEFEQQQSTLAQWHDHIGRDLILAEMEQQLLLDSVRQSDREYRLARSQRDALQEELAAASRLQDITGKDLIITEIEHANLQSDIAPLEAELTEVQESVSDYNEQLEQLTTKKRALEQQLVDVRKREKSADVPPIEPLAVNAPPPAVAAEPVAENRDPGFRISRLLSLESAMHDTSSSDRRNILITVIPTIPGGLKAREFANLVVEMDSNDIMAVLEAQHRNINTPVDKRSRDLIMAELNPEHHQRATELLP